MRHTSPDLNPIFHITSRKSYSAAGQEATRRTKLPHARWGRRNIFIFSSLSLPAPCPLPCLFYPKVKQFRNILPEYGCDFPLFFSLAPFQLSFPPRFCSLSLSLSLSLSPSLSLSLSLLPGRPVVMSSRLFDLRKRRNNALLPLLLPFSYFSSLSCLAMAKLRRCCSFSLSRKGQSKSKQETSDGEHPLWRDGVF